MEGCYERQIALNECKKCFIQRDYSNGLRVRFSNEFPLELEGKIEPEVWTSFVDDLNLRYHKADSVTFASVVESSLGFITCNLSRLCVPSVWNRVLKESETFIEERNRAVFIPNNLFIRDPATKGLRVIEVSILDEFVPQPQPTQESSCVTPMLTPRN
jgi:hypothetical protein